MSMQNPDEKIKLDLRDLDLYSSCHRILWGVLAGPSIDIQSILGHYKQLEENVNEWYSYPSWLFNNSHHSLPESYINTVRRIVQVLVHHKR